MLPACVVSLLWAPSLLTPAPRAHPPMPTHHLLQAAEALWSGCHVAFYIAAFSPAFQRALALGVNQLEHPYRDKAPDVAGALASRQFRFKVRGG